MDDLRARWVFPVGMYLLPEGGGRNGQVTSGCSQIIFCCHLQCS